VILIVLSGCLIWLGVRDVHLDCHKFLTGVEQAWD